MELETSGNETTTTARRNAPPYSISETNPPVSDVEDPTPPVNPTSSHANLATPDFPIEPPTAPERSAFQRILQQQRLQVSRVLIYAGLLSPPHVTAANPPSPRRRRSLNAPENETREERSERRRIRSDERRIQRFEMEEGAGLPTYTKDRAEGEKILESGAAAKEDEEEDGETVNTHEVDLGDEIQVARIGRILRAPGSEQISPRTEAGQ